MSYSQTVFLSLVQGLTEFLPISSSGHLVIFQKLFGIEKPPVLFDIMIHVGTLGAIIFYFKRDLLVTFKKIRAWWLIILGSIPAGLIGVFLNREVEVLFNSLDLVGASFLVTAIFLFSTKRLGKLTKSVEKISAADALLVGLFQALAILPGVSRSGSTIVAGLWRQIDRKAAFRFSFYLAIPAILGAFLLQVPDLLSAPADNLGQGVLGMIVAGITGYGALRMLEAILLRAKLWLFGIYCVILGLTVLLF
jgi:undecaprenyl-diphosphatase